MEETPSEGDSWLLSASLWSVNGGPSGHVELQFPPSEENLPRFVHTHHLSRETREDVRRRLLDTVLRVSFPWGSFSSIDDSELLSKLEEEKLVTAQWESPSEEYNRVDACMPENYAGFSEEETSAFEERSMHMDWCAGGRDKECDLRMVWGSRRARMSGKERIRGRSGGMPLMPGGGEWGAGSGTAVQAAVTEAGSGLWLEELEACMRTGRSSSRIAPPGMSKGAFGAWSDQHEASHDGGGAMLTPSGVEPDEWDLATETRERIEDLQEQAGDKPSDGGNVVKVHLDSLFDGVWVDEGLEDREEEEKELMEEDEVLNADERTSNVKDTPEQLKLEDKVTHSDKPVEVIESLLPEYGLSKFTQAVDEDHFMNSESSELMAVLNKASAIASNSYNPWDRNRFALPFEGSLKDPAGQRDGRKQTGEPSTWAIRAAVKDLERTWDSLKPNLAKTWPFELDIFQKEAIIHMEMGHSVFVAAHTSAGKTVAAEYAFALAEKHCSRAVYTSPIKTISNQKFRDFSQSDFEVGLLTGDVSIKPESSCLIMTTEILRSMLYKGADIVRDIEWVIFDEVHYVNDAERGVVWEEVIIMLPQHINLVLLSATVPNVLEFADWVGRTKRKPVYVTGTTRRPVPLQHCLYYSGQLFTISSQTTGYDGRGYRQAKEMHIKKHALPQTKAEAKAALPTGRGGGRGLHGSQARGRSSMTSGRGGGGRGHQSGRITREIREGARAHSGGAGTVQLRSEKTQWNAMIEFLRKKDLLPMVVFCFSKKRCDALADVLKSLDLTNSSEKSEIHIFCDRAVSRLRGSDKELPQVLRIREMLKRGLGVHHAGLLPIVKEMVEMLFCRGVIKVLFSTETFAMGVNAPARTVVFQSLRKHDGRSFRSLLPGEYTQMAGRAGRRGLDDVGTVIIVAWDLPEEVELRRLLTGAATKLESQFRLTYSMILNLLRVEDLTVEDMMKRSFAEFHAQRSHPEVKKAIQRAQKVLKHLRRKPWPASPLDSTREDVEEYVDVVLAAEGLEQKVQAAIMSTRGATAALASGRIVLVRQRDTGATEIGIIIDALSSASSSDLGAGRKGPSSSSLLSSSKPETPPVNGGDAELLNRTRVVLMLHRPSPLDDIKVTVLQEGGESFEKSSGAQKSERSDLEAQPPPELGMKALKRKDDDDDEFSVSVGPGRKGAGGKGRKGKHSKPPLPAAAPIPLPAHGSVGAIPYVLRHVRLADMVGVAKSKVQVDDESIITGDKVATAAAVNELLKLQENDAESSRLSLMDPISDLKLNDFDTAKAAREHQQLLRKLASLKVNRDPLLPEMLAIVRSEKLLAARLSKLDRQVSDAGLAQLPEFNHRVLVLQKLGYLDAEKTVTMKGRVACEINSGDELVATEMIFSGVLTDLTPEEAVAVLSALVFQEKTDGEPAVPESLERARDLAMTVALAAGEVQREAGLDILPEEFVASTLRFGLVEVVYEWAKGTPFAEICQLTDVMEGSIVRTMVRLDETCREVRDAARVMGDMTLYKQMEEASEAIKRDIVFAASLYVA